MSIAVQRCAGPAATESETAATLPAHAFVVFGITGDLAKVARTFHSLYEPERPGVAS